VVAFGEHGFFVRGEGGVVALRATPRIRGLRPRLRIADFGLRPKFESHGMRFVLRRL